MIAKDDLVFLLLCVNRRSFGERKQSKPGQRGNTEQEIRRLP
jgi:hypothetical protein